MATDLLGKEVKTGNYLLYSRGSLWQAVDYPETVFKYGHRIGVQQVIINRKGFTYPDTRKSCTYLPANDLILIHESGLTSVQTVVYNKLGADLWCRLSEPARLVNSQILKDRRKRLDSILVERGIRK